MIELVVVTKPQDAALAETYIAAKNAEAQFSQTDYGNALRLVSQHGGEIRWVAQFEMWFIWDGFRWKPDANGEIMRRAKSTVRAMYKEAAEDWLSKQEAIDRAKHANASASLRSLKAMVELAKSEPGITISQSEFDTDPMLFGVPNGAIDLRTGILIGPNPAHYITKHGGVEYCPEAVCPLWESTLLGVFAGDSEKVRYLQRSCGYSLSASTAEQIMLICWGQGANGKSTIFNIWNAVQNDYGKPRQASTLQPRHNDNVRSDLVELAGARLVTTSEIGESKPLDEPLVKQLTGGDDITARPLYGSYITFKPTFKLVVATNHKPILRGGYAIERRIHLLHFSVTFTRERRDEALEQKLRAELPGILAWMVRGCIEWQAQGLNPPVSVLDATAAYIAEMDVFAQWIEEACVVEPGAKMQAGPAYKNYSAWIIARGAKPMMQNSFCRKLVDEKGFPHKKQGTYFYHGIGFKAVDGGDDAAF